MGQSKGRGNLMKWMSVHEHLPEEGRAVVCYSEVFRKYYLAYFCPHRGWIDQENERLRIITHWHDEKIDFPFDSSGEFDEEKARSYGIGDDNPSKFGYFTTTDGNTIPIKINPIKNENN